MAWPFSRKRTYAPLVQVPSADMNDIQDGVVGVVGGTASVKALLADGTGNNPVVPSSPLVAGWATLTDVPLVLFKDKLGNVRYLVDHNGYPMGLGRSEIREEWRASGTFTNTGAIANYGQVVIANTATSSIQLGSGLLAGYGFASAKITTGTTAGTQSLWLPPGFQAGNANISAALSLEVALPNVSTVTHTFGLTDGTVNNGCYFTCPSRGNWFIQSLNASVGGSVNTGVASTTAVTRLHIELHGANSPYGTCARFFINEALVGTITTNLPSNTATTLSPWWFAGVGGSSEIVHIGSPVLLGFNHYLSMPLL